jgi:hypothetical protein
VKGNKMKSHIKYIEHKPAEHTDRADAWIAHVWPSSSGKTLYFNNMALKKKSGGGDATHFDLITGEYYWVTGVKKRGTNRHFGETSPIQIEESLVDWYKKHTQGNGHKRLIVIKDLIKPDIVNFTKIENDSITIK